MMEFSEVRARVGGLKGVIEKLGDAPPEHKWKSFPKCPFCGHKDSAGIWTENGAEFFKCHFPGCNTGRRTVTEVGYVAMRLGLSEDKPTGGGPSPAYQKLLELAGAWEEPKAQSAQAANAPVEARRRTSATEPRPGNDGPLLLRQGYGGQVAKSGLAGTKWTKRRGLVAGGHRGDSRGGQSEREFVEATAEVGVYQSGSSSQRVGTSGGVGAGAGEAVARDIEFGFALLRQGCGGRAASDSSVPEPEDVGIKGQGSDDPGAAVGPTAPNLGLASSEVAPCSGPAFIEGVPAASESPQAGASSPPAVPAAAGSKGELEPGQAGLRWYFERLEPTWEQKVPRLPDGPAAGSVALGAAEGGAVSHGVIDGKAGIVTDYV